MNLHSCGVVMVKLGSEEFCGLCDVRSCKKVKWFWFILVLFVCHSLGDISDWLDFSQSSRQFCYPLCFSALVRVISHVSDLY